MSSRRIIGITGPPGVGKTTYAVRLATEVGGVHLPMDGFHLADVALDRLGLRDRKGAPETFDAWGYAALLARLRSSPPEVVWAPAFERDLEQPLAGAIAIDPATEVVVTEGNYLLLDTPEWRAVRAQLDEVVYLDEDEELRRQRLVERHVRFGKTPEEARAWVARVDDANAALVARAKAQADRVVDLRR
jgi:pantothenate kinase